MVDTILEFATPASLFGVALGMLFPPHFSLAFGVGRAIRCFLDKKHGKEFWENDALAASGFLAGSMIVKGFMTILLKVVWEV